MIYEMYKQKSNGDECVMEPKIIIIQDRPKNLHFHIKDVSRKLSDHLYCYHSSRTAICWIGSFFQQRVFEEIFRVVDAMHRVVAFFAALTAIALINVSELLLGGAQFLFASFTLSELTWSGITLNNFVYFKQ